jgi:NAD(P)-dependent dehydrogenase (short-subunit alcohol dehydrogenase family)
MGRLAGCHALVTGGGTGIGAAIARALAAEGARLTLAGRRLAPLEDVAKALPQAIAAAADVTREADCTAMVEAARRTNGPVDIVVANAGAAASAPVAATGLADWQRMIDVNLTGAFLTVRAALGDVTRREGEPATPRRIILIASTAGLKGYPYVAAYVAAKHGVVGLARALAVELAQTPVTVNAVCPGFTETALLEASVAAISAKTGRPTGDARAALMRANPQGRFVQPEEVAAAVVWLASPEASSVTGQAIAVAGGEL